MNGEACGVSPIAARTWATRLCRPASETNVPGQRYARTCSVREQALSWRNPYLGAPDIAVARDRIVFNLGEHAGNVWMTGLPPDRR
jgi:hypothetical protein